MTALVATRFCIKCGATWNDFAAMVDQPIDPSNCADRHYFVLICYPSSGNFDAKMRSIHYYHNVIIFDK